VNTNPPITEFGLKLNLYLFLFEWEDRYKINAMNKRFTEMETEQILGHGACEIDLILSALSHNGLLSLSWSSEEMTNRK
jgi:hypothetical protein